MIFQPGVNDVVTAAPWMIPYFQGGAEEAAKYSKSSHKYINPKCPYCGRVREKPIRVNEIYNRHGLSCPCNDNITMPNKMIYFLARDMKSKGLIKDFIREETVPNTNGMKMDMHIIALNGKECYVEMDGGFHPYIKIKHSNKPVFVNAGAYKRDDLKDAYAKSLNIPLIRIDCYKPTFKQMKEDLEASVLSNMVDLTMVDWSQIEIDIYGNLAKDICTYKNNHPDETSTQMAKVFDLSVSTITKYLKIGHDLGWCHYVGKEAWYDAHKNLLRKNTDIFTSVTVMPDNRIFYFKSGAQLISESEEVLGTKITRSEMQKQFKENKNGFTYKNLYIKRITMEEYLDGICKS